MNKLQSWVLYSYPRPMYFPFLHTGCNNLSLTSFYDLPQLPIAMIGISWLMNGSIKSVAADIVGCIVGHFVWFLLDVWPLELSSGEGKTILKPPNAL